jgi:hypothetical protein
MAQGLGEGPDQVLAGTGHGGICLLEQADQPHPSRWTLADQADHGEVCSMAATDQVVVAGYEDGNLRIIRMDTAML